MRPAKVNQAVYGPVQYVNSFRFYLTVFTEPTHIDSRFSLRYWTMHMYPESLTLSRCMHNTTPTYGFTVY